MPEMQRELSEQTTGHVLSSISISKWVPQGTLVLQDVTSWYLVESGFMMKYSNLNKFKLLSERFLLALVSVNF